MQHFRHVVSVSPIDCGGSSGQKLQGVMGWRWVSVSASFPEFFFFNFHVKIVRFVEFRVILVCNLGPS